MKIPHSLLLTGLAVFSASVAQAQLFNFDTAGQLDNNFNSTGSGSGIGKWSEQSGNGIGGSDSVVAGAANNQGTEVYTSAIDGSLSTYSVSMMFEFAPVPTESTGGAGLFIGFGSSDTWNGAFTDTGGADDNQFMVALTGNGAGVRRLINYSVTDGVETADNPGAGNNFNLTEGNWYQLRLDVTNNGDNTFNIVSSIFNVNGTTGVVGSLVKDNDTNNIANTDWAGGANSYAFFGGQSGSDNRIGLNYDNFRVAVPEPSSYALISGALALAWIMVRRRK